MRASGVAGIPPDECGPGMSDDRDDFAERRLVFRRALELVRPEFEPATYEAARRLLIERQPASVIAAEMGKSRNAVYIAKSRVLRRVRETLKQLGELGGAADTVDGPQEPNHDPGR